ncbi:MAG: SsrA-binding protein [Alphaproteobacteria bacterium]|nr:SsrA-binding protein [Alphaproteobacteria bacterium]
MAYIQNKKARIDYEILENIQAGISLRGTEAKSVRAGKGSLVGAQARIGSKGLLLTHAHIPAFQENNIQGLPPQFDPYRERILLIQKKERAKINHALENKYTLIPLSLYAQGRVIKCDIGICKKKKIFDKRISIKKREITREIERGMRE